MIDLKALSAEETEEFLKGMGLPAYRSRQFLHWIYERYASSIEEITEFSITLRKALAHKAYISNLDILSNLRSIDGAEKFLFGLSDGETIEAVFMPDNGRATLCVSTQVGCAMGCRFCRTGIGGLRRNLRAHEIVDQVITLKRLGRPITNIVLMGMGEPLKNLKEVSEALWRISRLLKISPRRITLSTVGIPEVIRQLPNCIPPVNLAVSLNAPEDPMRDEIMPVNRQHPLRGLMESLRRYPLKKGRRITFEYVMLKDINDSEDAALGIARLVRGLPCKINLIPFNHFEGSPYMATEEAKILRFQQVLIERNLSVFIRKSRGADINAACGQLRGSWRQNNGNG